MKKTIMSAASLMGMDVTAFILSLVAPKAQEVVEKHATIKLSLEAQKHFAHLSKPLPVPTTAMSKLKELPSFEVRQLSLRPDLVFPRISA
jgi:uncharacterized protein (DUF1778 family)